MPSTKKSGSKKPAVPKKKSPSGSPTKATKSRIPDLEKEIEELKRQVAFYQRRATQGGRA